MNVGWNLKQKKIEYGVPPPPPHLSSYNFEISQNQIDLLGSDFEQIMYEKSFFEC